MKYKAIVIGVSSGGMNALKFIFSALSSGFIIPIILVQHIGARSDNQWIHFLNKMSNLKLKEADEKEKIEPGQVYVAPANYHLLIEKDETLSLTIGERVSFARPSIDVLFESAAPVYRDSLIGIILTGANNDGSKGMKRIQEFGGLTIVEDPKTAEVGYMPASVITTIKPDYILPLAGIADLLMKLSADS